MKTTLTMTIEIKKWKCGRNWAIYTNGELLAVTVYRRGAMAIAETLQQYSVGGGATILAEESEPHRPSTTPPKMALLAI